MVGVQKSLENLLWMLQHPPDHNLLQFFFDPSLFPELLQVTIVICFTCAWFLPADSSHLVPAR